MTEPVITCPNCKGEIKLTETLAAPLLEIERRKLEQVRRDGEAAVAKRESAAKAAELNAQEKLAEATRRETEVNALVQSQVDSRLKVEREGIQRAADRRAAEGKEAELKAMREELTEKSSRLADAQKAELQLRQERTKLQEEKERFELDKQRAIDEERVRIRTAAMKEAGEQFRLKDAENQKVISDMKAQMEEMRRKMEQGSQQLQGEVHELDLEATLRAAFPHDVIEPVGKGQFGGDVVQRVVGPEQTVVGSILWEAKRTKNWSDLWLAKLKGDQREAKADAAIILTTAMPKGCESFIEMDGVWVTNNACALPLAHALRAALKEVALARSAADGQQTKMELVYAYLMGPGFRRRVEAIKEAFENMLGDLEAEKRVIQKQWAKREVQIRAVIDNTVGMYGELQGIAGRSLPEIEGLEMKALEGGESSKFKAQSSK